MSQFHDNRMVYRNSTHSGCSSRSMPLPESSSGCSNICELKNLASQKIFSVLLLNAYRQRGIEIKRLRCNLSSTKCLLGKSENQIHVKDSLYSWEKSQNDTLVKEIDGFISKLRHSEATCEKSKTKIKNLNIEIKQLKEQLEVKTKDFDELNSTYNATKSAMSRNLDEQRKIQNNLSSQQRHMQHLENQNTQLIKEVNDCRNRNRCLEAEYRKQKREKGQEISKINNIIDKLHGQLIDLTCKSRETEELKQKEKKVQKEMQLLRHECKEMKEKFRNSRPVLSSTMRYLYPFWRWCWCSFQKTDFDLYYISFCLLIPALCYF